MRYVTSTNISSVVKKLLVVLTFIAVAFFVHLAGEAVLAGEPLSALSIVACVLLAVFCFIRFAKYFEKDD